LAWQIEFDESAKKELAKLDRQVARRLIEFLKDRVLSRKDPRSVGQVELELLLFSGHFDLLDQGHQRP
jgi:mRNA-degrading endonuclease RelE of RelBE toxin-antitoxin system